MGERQELQSYLTSRAGSAEENQQELSLPSHGRIIRCDPVPDRPRSGVLCSRESQAMAPVYYTYIILAGAAPVVRLRPPSLYIIRAISVPSVFEYRLAVIVSQSVSQPANQSPCQVHLVLAFSALSPAPIPPSCIPRKSSGHIRLVPRLRFRPHCCPSNLYTSPSYFTANPA